LGALRHPFSVEHVTLMVRHVFSERVTFHSGEGEVAPGVTLHRVGGHSDGLQVVRVETARVAGGAGVGRGALLRQSASAQPVSDRLQHRRDVPVAGKSSSGLPVIPIASSPATILSWLRSTRAPATTSMPSPCTRRRHVRSRNRPAR